ncbi:tRNA lysidine(34) synthetase TilS [uncultured Aliiroseovarius sp.]|uniref:tRNA lysidine(34) synthetase TilS n=1 Tax=uncultured Aliiroseovarius sp. TaxID=1658783 RepID=UPI00260C896F|nr:tRNA lysidine(34) synthetase TilS [uncultured Aliiroseovarius sp.]
MRPEQTFEFALDRARQRGPVSRLGLAVSGGSDSMAMLVLAAAWAKKVGADLRVATVDHGLRPEAAEEANWVKARCAELGLPHDTLTWADAPSGNVQSAARAARYELLANWAQGLGLDAVAVGHTADDQAETFVMRLARGSGVDGLSAMQDDWQAQKMRWLRPVLATGRDDLRQCLTERGLGWIDDPSNTDARFERVRVRKAMKDLALLGLDRDRLVGTALRMTEARTALEQAALDAAETHAEVILGDVVFDISAYSVLPTETRHRLLTAAIRFVSGAAYRPRYDALKEIEAQVLEGQRRTLSGCVLHQKSGQLVVGRELNALRSEAAQSGESWDGRWVLTGPAHAQVRVLANAISDCPDWRNIGQPRDRLMTTPALFVGDQILAAPAAGFLCEGVTLAGPSKADFLKAILSH